MCLSAKLVPVDHIVINNSLMNDSGEHMGEFSDSIIQQALKEKEEVSEFNRSLIDALQEASFDYLVEDGTISWNGACTNVFGYSAQEAGANWLWWSQKIHYKDKSVIRKEFKKALVESKLFDIEFRAKNKDEKYIWLHIRAKLLRNKEDALVRIIGTVSNVHDKKTAEDKLIKAVMRTQISAVIRGKDAERKRIAAELHDGLGQMLTVASLELDSLKASMNGESESTKKKIEDALNLINRAIDETRTISHDLMPASLEDFGLQSSIQHLVNSINTKGKTHFNFYEDTLTSRFDEDVEMNLFRITQECMQNILKHADAKNGVIQLIEHENSVILMIEDDGKGYDPSQAHDGLGVKNIQNRVAALDGKLNFDSSKKGTVITVEILL